MYLQNIATELISHIFHSCTSVSDVLSLASTCKRFHRIYHDSQKLVILEHAAEAQYGPLDDITQLLTHNASQPAHLHRSAPFSFALLRQIIHAGRVAEQWCDIYPFKKWKHNFESRRLLTSAERYRLRRALYRLWLYSTAFHNERYVRGQRMLPRVVHERAQLLHNFSTAELAEMADAHTILRQVAHSIVPSNSTISRKFRKRFPDTPYQLVFNIHLNYPIDNGSSCQHPNALAAHFHNSLNLSSMNSPSSPTYAKFLPTRHHEPGSEGWGDDNYYVVEDMLKLDPGQLLWLKNHAPLKSDVEAYTKGLGDWFENNGETWADTMVFILGQRSEDVEELMGMVEAGELGITAPWEDD